MSSAPKYIPHYTLADYRQWEGDWELWSGVPVAMTPSPFGPHQAVAARLIRLLGNELERAACDCQVLHEIDWLISDDTIVRPDVVIVCGGTPERHLQEPPALVAEVISPSTEAKDRGVKRQLYQQQAVAYYLILDPDGQTCETYDCTGRDTYQLLASNTPVQLNLSQNCQIHFDPSDLFA